MKCHSWNRMKKNSLETNRKSKYKDKVHILVYATRGVLFAQDCLKRSSFFFCFKISLSISCYYPDHQIYHLGDPFFGSPFPKKQEGVGGHRFCLSLLSECQEACWQNLFSELFCLNVFVNEIQTEKKSGAGCKMFSKNKDSFC